MTTAPTTECLRRMNVTLRAMEATAPALVGDTREALREAYRARTLTSSQVGATLADLNRLFIDTFGIYSDEYLTVQAAEYRAGYTNGYSRAAHYLLDAPAANRAAVVAEANLASNMTGSRYADEVAVQSRQPLEAQRRWDAYLAGKGR